MHAAFPGLGPEAGRAASLALRWLRTDGRDWSRAELVLDVEPPVVVPVSPLLLTVARCSPFQIYGEADVRELASYTPGDLRTFFAWGALKLQHNLDWHGAEWENYALLEPLLLPHVPLDSMALVLLAFGLAAKQPREHALAIDVLVRRATPAGAAALGRVLASLWVPMQEEVKWVQRPAGMRWAKTLGTLARTSRQHAEFVHDALDALWAAQPTSTPPDIHALLELGYELCVETGRTPSADARAFVTTLTRGGKTKAARARLLAL